MHNVAVGVGASALHKLLAEYQPDIVNRHLGLLMTTMNWTIRATDPITAINELDLRITDYELQNNERVAYTVKRGVLLKGVLHAEVQKLVMKDSAVLNSYERVRADVVDLLRAAPLALSGTKGKGKMKDKGNGKTDDSQGKGKSKGKARRGKETRVCHECNESGHLRRDCFKYKKRVAEKGNKEKVERHLLRCKERWSKRGSTLKRTLSSCLEIR